MLLSHVHRFIYTKTIKTAGTSVEIYFEGACVPPGSHMVRGHRHEETITSAGIIGYRGGDPSGHIWYNHMPAKAIRELTGYVTWSEYFKFCIIRNPFDKMVSLWWFINSGQELRYENEPFSRIRIDFSRWCTDHATDAVDRDKYMIGDKLSVDYCMKFENLIDDLETVCRRIDYPFKPGLLGTFKNRFRILKQPFEEYYDQQAIAAVEAAFSWELDYFGYDRLSTI